MGNQGHKFKHTKIEMYSILCIQLVPMRWFRCSLKQLFSKFKVPIGFSLLIPMASQVLSDSDIEVPRPLKIPKMADTPDQAGQLSDSDGEDIKLVYTPTDPVEACLDIMPGLRDVPRDIPLKMAEVFAGCGALSHAMSHRGFPTWTVDFKIGGAAHDFSNADTAMKLANDLGDFNYIHFAPPCNTFSMARYPKLRIGFPNVSNISYPRKDRHDHLTLKYNFPFCRDNMRCHHMCQCILSFIEITRGRSYYPSFIHTIFLQQIFFYTPY